MFVSFLSVTTICHIISCLWFLSAKLEGFGPDTWVFRHEYMNDDPDIQYMASLYWTYTTMSTVGYGDIYAGTDIERVLAILVMVFGVCFFSFTIGSISSFFSRIDNKEAVMNKKMAVIDGFAKEAKLDSILMIRLKLALQYSTEKTGFSWSE